MIQCSGTTDKVQIVTGSASTVDVHESHVDLDDSASPRTVNAGDSNTAITTATTTDVVAAPGASKVRRLKILNVRNKHATTSTAITVKHVSSATVELFKATLAPGEQLSYTERNGWEIFDSQGNLRTTVDESTEARLAGPTQPAKSEAGTTIYDPVAGIRANIRTAIVTNTHASLWGWLTLSVGSIATKANRIVSGLPVPPKTTFTIPLDLVLDGDANGGADDLRARQTVDMTYTAMTVASAVALIADTNAGAATALATASWAAKNAACYVMFVSWTGTPTISSFTDTHSGITWTLVDQIDNTAGDTHLAVYRAQSSGTTNTTTTVTFSAAPTGVFISIQELVGADSSGSHGDAAIMKAGTRYLSPTNTNLYLPGTEQCGARLAAFMHNGAAGTWTPGAGFTEVHDGTYATPSTAFESAYALTPGNDASAVASTTSAENLMAMVDIQDNTKVLTVTIVGVEKVK